MAGISGPTLSDQATRVPPQDLEAERAVLGAMLLDREAIGLAIETLGNEDVFYRTPNRKIFRALLRLYERNEAADLITLSDELRKDAALEEAGGEAYLASLLDHAGTSAHVEHYAKIVLEKATLRRLIDAASRIVRDGFDGREDPNDLIDRAEQQIFAIADTRLRRGFVRMKDLITDSFKVIQSLYETKKHVTGVPSGFVDLDLKTAGFQPSDLIVVAGRPSMGKTSFALNIAENVAIHEKTPVAFFSLEMSRQQLALRILCSQARVSAHRLRTGYIRDGEWPHLTAAAGKLSEAPIYIDDSPAISVLEMRAKARRLKADVNLGLVVIDYLQLVRGLPNVESRQQEISQISRSLKALAKELSIPVIALSQLSRAVELRGGDKRPVLSDLRESGAIEQDADVVLFIFREEHYKRTPENEGIGEVILGKQRNGPVGTVKLTFLAEFTRFENMARIEGEPARPADEPF
jgi:replicative DNA helicase